MDYSIIEGKISEYRVALDIGGSVQKNELEEWFYNNHVVVYETDGDGLKWYIDEVPE